MTGGVIVKLLLVGDGPEGVLKPVLIGLGGISVGGSGNRERRSDSSVTSVSKLIVLSAIPEALVSREGAWR